MFSLMMWTWLSRSGRVCSCCQNTKREIKIDVVEIIILFISHYPESDDVPKLVNDDAELVTVLTDGNCLRAVASFSDERTTPFNDYKF